MSIAIQLPGRTDRLVLEPPPWAAAHPRPRARRVYAAAHVAATSSGTIDWDATLAFRRHLWSHGFAVAEAMDTAQRGMGLSWGQTKELIARSAAAAREEGAAIACGAGTDQLGAQPGSRLGSGAGRDLATVVAAYEEQIDVVQDAGAEVVLMASRALAAAAQGPGDYVEVYRHLFGRLRAPVILHWLGDAFDPALAGYWGASDLAAAAEVVLDIVAQADGAVSGIKLSVLDAAFEVALRRRLPAGVRLYTGDDFHYPGLIRGDADGHSDALLGVFAAIAAPAAEALEALDRGDAGRYDTIMDATLPLARHLFAAPTYFYKTGIAFLAWLNGWQPAFAMLDHFEDRRPPGHLLRAAELAAGCGALTSPEVAAARLLEYTAAVAGDVAVDGDVAVEGDV